MKAIKMNVTSSVQSPIICVTIRPPLTRYSHNCSYRVIYCIKAPMKMPTFTLFPAVHLKPGSAVIAIATLVKQTAF